MKASLTTVLAVCVGCMAAASAAQTGATPRTGFSIGMGVHYLTPPDVVAMINGGYAPAQKVPEFHAGVDFFGSFILPLSTDWAVRAEYAYMVNSYSISSVFGPGEFTMMVHMPTLFGEYILADEGLYNLSAGVGIGYHFGALTVRYLQLDDRYTAKGPALAFMLTGNTAIGDDLFVHLAAEARWEFPGELRNANGRSPGLSADGTPAGMYSFGVGARLGMSYYISH